MTVTNDTITNTIAWAKISSPVHPESVSSSLVEACDQYYDYQEDEDTDTMEAS